MTIEQALRRLALNVAVERHPLSLVIQKAMRRRILSLEDRRSGLVFRCLAGAETMMTEVFLHRVYDVPLAPVRPGDLVVDVGANHGFATCHFAKQGARVVAVEPDPDVFPLLEENVRRNGFAEQTSLHALALAGESRTREFLQSAGDGGARSTLQEILAERTGTPIRGRVSVTTSTLPALLHGISEERIRLVKLDCEGSELEILRGIAPSLLERIDSIALELHPEVATRNDLLELVRSWPGFSLSKVRAYFENYHIVSSTALAQWAAS